MYIYLKIKNNNFYDKNNHLIKIMNVKKPINIFVGENNSGKSRLIKQILNKNNECVYFNETLKNSSVPYFYNEIQKIIESDTNSKIDFRKENEKIKSTIEKIYFLLNYVNENNIDVPEQYIDELLKETNISYFPISKNVKYIPILRGNENYNFYYPPKDKLNNIKMTIPQYQELNDYIDVSKTIYKNKISTVYDMNKDIIFTGEELYDEIVDILLGEEKKRNKFHEFEKFIDEMFYESKGFHINPDKFKKCLKVKIGDGNEYEIHNMGEGIKQLITILYPIYMNKEQDNIFFIEEPEINLHPGFQRKLLELLVNNFNNNKYFITTHSNHIMDIVNFSDEVDIFKFHKNNEKIFLEKLDNSYISALSELGVNTSSVMLANCTIWVEGISDRIYLKKYIEMCFKKRDANNKYKEGIHYSFVEYGGGNITHWNFDETNIDNNLINVNYLNYNSFLIVDNDGTSIKKNKDGANQKKEKRKQQLREILKERFYELKSRESENIIKLEVLEKTLMEDNNLKEIKRKKYLDEIWSKKYNQSLISSPNVSIGSFIDETYELNKTYKSYNGNTLKSKAEFAIKVCKNVYEWDDLSEEAKELANIVCDFIEKNNN